MHASAASASATSAALNEARLFRASASSRAASTARMAGSASSSRRAPLARQLHRFGAAILGGGRAGDQALLFHPRHHLGERRAVYAGGATTRSDWLAPSASAIAASSTVWRRVTPSGARLEEDLGCILLGAPQQVRGRCAEAKLTAARRFARGRAVSAAWRLRRGLSCAAPSQNHAKHRKSRRRRFSPRQ